MSREQGSGLGKPELPGRQMSDESFLEGGNVRDRAGIVCELGGRMKEAEMP